MISFSIPTDLLTAALFCLLWLVAWLVNDHIARRGDTRGEP